MRTPVWLALLVAATVMSSHAAPNSTPPQVLTNVPGTSNAIVVGPCPVCHTDPQVLLQPGATTTTFDRDWMPDNWDPNTIVTCPKCHYSRYFRQFTDPVPADVAHSIQDGGVLKVPPHAGATLPGWARCDLAAQTEALLSGRQVPIAWYYMDACYSVRAETLPPITDHPDFPGVTAPASQFINERDLSKARQVLKRLGTMKGEERTAAASFALRVLFKHGETDTLLPNLPMLIDAAGDSEDAMTLRDAIQIDRHFQQLALQQFTKASTQPQTDALDSMVHYMMGELDRRLGNYAAARKEYDDAKEEPDLKPTVARWLVEQTGLLPPK